MPSGSPRVLCRAVRYLRDPQPGMIEAYLTDATGFEWQIVDKAVMFAEWREFMPGAPLLPMDVTLACTILEDEGEDRVRIFLPDVSDRVYVVRRELIVAQAG